MEIYKKVIWKYEVSNLWNVKSLNYNNTWKEKIIKKFITCWWYEYVNMTIDKKYINMDLYHMLVIILWIEFSYWENHSIDGCKVRGLRIIFGPFLLS